MEVLWELSGNLKRLLEQTFTLLLPLSPPTLLEWRWNDGNLEPIRWERNRSKLDPQELHPAAIPALTPDLCTWFK